MPHADTGFAGSIPQVYDRYLVPLIFQSYADDLAARIARRRPASVLEIAAGTGVLTRALAQVLPASCTIVATDLNQPMLDQAALVGTARPVTWQQADAMHLPFPDASFDLVACQFGVMFFPDKAKAYAETRRVLKPGGQFIFNVWDRIGENEFPDTVTLALETIFPDDPPRFMARIPHGYHNTALILRDLAQGGFTAQAEWTTLPARSRADSAAVAALAFCQGTPLRNEIEARVEPSLAAATRVAELALARRFGSDAVDGKIQAHVVMVAA